MDGRGQEAKVPDVRKLPLCLGLWNGEDNFLRDEILAFLGADVCVQRTYTNAGTKSILLNLAVFSDVRRGLFQTPISCYKASGWELRSQAYEQLRINNEKFLRVSVSRWERKQYRVAVLFWYQLGGHVLFQRSDLEKLEVKLGDQGSRPHLVRILMQTGQSSPGEAESDLRKLACSIAQWLDGSRGDP